MFELTTSPIDGQLLKNRRSNDLDGAFVCFEGIVRADQHHQTHVNSLTYHADHTQCNLEGTQIVNDTLKQFPISHVLCVQRIGTINVGEPAIWIGVWASHRDEAFKGCRYIIEEVKKRLHIWKKESHTDGTSKWIHGKTS